MPFLCGVIKRIDRKANRRSPEASPAFRHRHRITIRSALNLSYEEWAGFLGNRPMVEPLLSRLRHYCHTVRIEGPSLRQPRHE